MLSAIDAAPRRSRQRYDLFQRMHDGLAALRREHQAAVAAAERRAAEAPIVNRRDWPFPLYPTDMIDALADAVCRQRVASAGPA
jgi:hypothetical protein